MDHGAHAMHHQDGHHADFEATTMKGLHHQEHHNHHPAATMESSERSAHHHQTAASNHGMDGHMNMFFHGGYEEVILFDFWRINSVEGLIGSMIGCFLLAILYEGLKFLRENLIRNKFRRLNYKAQEIRRKRSVEAPPQGSSSGKIETLEASIWSKTHGILTVLHLIQLSIAYLLMLVVMTYNSWLCLAIVIGASVGYFLFGWRRTIILEEEGHCH